MGRDEGAISRSVIGHDAIYLSVIDHRAIDHGAMDQSAVGHSVADDGAMDHGPVDHGAMGHGAVGRGVVDDDATGRNAVGHGAVEHGAMHRGAMGRDVVRRDGVDHEAIEKGAVDWGAIAAADGSAGKVTCLGEAMAVLIPDGLVPDGAASTYTLAVGGAEANVACSLAALGVPVRWVGRVGDDHFGRVVLRTLAERGVDVSDVEIDASRQTGLYVKEIAAPAAADVGEPLTRMRYYRTGSAACAMGSQLAETSALRDTPLLHLSGITPALSESCAALIDTVLGEPRPGRLVSFDVNLRPALWSGRDPAVLLDLARRADLVFLGADEAMAICGVGSPDELRRLLPEPGTLVVKQGADGAVGFEGTQRVRVSALPVEVAETTGAGDAFAAGFIAATLRGLPLRDRLRLGTLTAAGALRVRGDFAAMPSPAEIARFLAGDERSEPGISASGVEAGVG